MEIKKEYSKKEIKIISSDLARQILDIYEFEDEETLKSFLNDLEEDTLSIYRYIKKYEENDFDKIQTWEKEKNTSSDLEILKKAIKNANISIILSLIAILLILISNYLKN